MFAHAAKPSIRKHTIFCLPPGKAIYKNQTPSDDRQPISFLPLHPPNSISDRERDVAFGSVSCVLSYIKHSTSELFSNPPIHKSRSGQMPTGSGRVGFALHAGRNQATPCTHHNPHPSPSHTILARSTTQAFQLTRRRVCPNHALRRLLNSSNRTLNVVKWWG